MNNNDDYALLTDLYQITMAQGYWACGKLEEEGCFHIFFRETPFKGGFAIASGMGTCGLLGPIGIVLGWFDSANGYPGTVGALDWVGLVLICFLLPAALSYAFYLVFRRIGWIKDGYMKLD